jgi:succinyl-diaminopimelate desuccinylase
VTGAELLARTAALVDVPSASHDEAALADLVERELRAAPWLVVERLGDNVVARSEGRRGTRLLVAGHLDTVPPAGNDRAKVVEETLFGLGASDMKGGLAVMLALATSRSVAASAALDVTWCFYACEEVAHEHNGLARLWRERPDLMEADGAVLCEPTGGRVEAGCQGSLRAVVEVRGARAHTARPFTGRNAIHRLAPVLERVSGWRGREVVLDGCTYVEQLQAVAVHGGVAGNVVPDLVTLTLNHRFAPDRSAEQAATHLAACIEDLLDEALGDTIGVVDAADAAPPSLAHPVLDALVTLSGEPPRAKLGWTDVATMWAHGVPAANFGPGDPLLAHRPDEHVTAAALDHACSVLGALISSARPASDVAARASGPRDEVAHPPL